MGILQVLNNLFAPKVVDRPEYYLEGDIKVYKDNNGNFHFTTITRTYIKNLCDKIKTLFEINIRTYGQYLVSGYHS